MISVEEKIKEIEMCIEANPNYQSGLYRKLKGEILPGSMKYKVKDEEWEGNIFAGKDIVDAVKDGWWDSYEELPNALKDKKGSTSTGAVEIEKEKPIRNLAT